MITIDDVRVGVISALDAQCPTTPIYGEEIRQGFQEPCFFVKLLQGEHSQVLGRRYARTHSFDIHYFTGTNGDLHAMAEQLYGCLETIQAAGSTCRGQGMSHEIVDGVLHFLVSYDFHVLRERPEVPIMQDVQQEGGLK